MLAGMADLKAAAIAANRFGFGARHGELAAIASDPRGWLKSQLPKTPPAALTATPSSARLAQFFEARRERKTDVDLATMYKKELHEEFRVAAGRRTLAAAASPTPFRERLAQFWSNHFTVSIQRPVVIPVATGFEDEAIRPYVLGRFGDLLRAVAKHPAMLLYLDNAQSVGPDSTGGRAKDKGLNENLAREMLELHTVGVDGGYSQADVTEFAKILTGWSIARENEPGPGEFRYRPMIHEPGDKTLLGRTYKEAGMDEAVAAMDDLAARPATARHIATKLARHFVADDPPPALVARLENSFNSTGGRLDKVAETLIDSPESWAPEQRKFKTPYEFLVSSYRSAGVTPGLEIAPVLTGLGQTPFSAPSPKGWAEDAQSWASPDGVVKRMDWAEGFSAKVVTADANPMQMAENTLGARLTPATATAIGRAESRTEAFSILLMSPEFQRR